MPDAIFEEPRLAAIYDVFGGERGDLDAYVGVVAELGARSVLDVGCGTGCLALRLAGASAVGVSAVGACAGGGLDVVGVDPAAASLEVARAKPGSDRVRWLPGDATTLPPLAVDLAVLTGNVAQAILGPAWPATLSGLHDATRPGGHLCFESRIPAARAWEAWTPDRTRRHRDVPGIGAVETWVEVLAVEQPLVTFRHTYVFEADGSVLTSDSTLQFRELDELTDDVEEAGFDLVDVRDAPDRPGLEYVVLARRP